MTSFADLVGCRLPLQLAGMGGIGDAALASAVSDAGGLGMLGAAGLPSDALTATIEQVSSTAPFGVNFLMPFLDRGAVRTAALSVPVVEFFYGDPDAELVELVRDGGAIAGWQVGSLDEARAAVAAGCAFVVVQGAEAGGHVRGTEPLDTVLRAVAAIDVPIVAAGGIGTAADVARALEAGASAVRIGTRFVAASESCAHADYIDALIASEGDDTILTEAFSVGWPDAPHRVLRACVDAANATADDVVATMRVGPGVDMPVPRFATPPPTMNTTGNVAAMAQYAGTSVAAVRSRQPAAEIAAELCAQL